jgi:hypothetical protein
MKHFDWILFLAAMCFFIGCTAVKLPHYSNGEQVFDQDGARVTVKQLESPKHIPATQAAKTSPVAAAVSKIVHWMEFAGLVCLIAAAALFYFGLILPGAKCAIAGVVLPVSAVWFNYHYGLVIAGILISSAIGFVWAVNQKHPEYLAQLEKKIREQVASYSQIVHN